jgi:ferritin-like metal-binding protein YciE
MGWFTSLKIETLEDLLLHELKDLYDAEQRIVDALPKMVDAAHSPKLKSAFQNHLAETKNHVSRLEEAFQQLGETPEATTCPAMKGLLSEGEEIIDAKGDEMVIDAALIAAAQRVEHYEMAGYGAARSIARRLGHAEVANVLQATLDEEGSADKTLTQIAESQVNPQAQRASR